MIIKNPKFNQSIPVSATNQPFVFDQPQVINQQTGQMSNQAAPVKPEAPIVPGATPPAPPSATPTPASPVAAAVAGKTEPTAKENLLAKLTTAMGQPTFAETEAGKGMATTKTKYAEEETKTLNLLDQLEEDITKRTGGFLVSEAEKNRILASEKAPLLKGLTATQRGKELATTAYTEAEKAYGAPMEKLKEEATLLNLLKTDKETELDVYNSPEGRRVATLWSSETGKIRQVDLGPAPVTKETPPTVGNKLTLNEAKSLGLPSSLVGMTEEDIGNQLSSENPPVWFREIKSQEKKMTIIPSVLQKMWDDFRSGILSKKSSTSNVNTATNNAIDFNNL